MLIDKGESKRRFAACRHNLGAPPSCHEGGAPSSGIMMLIHVSFAVFLDPHVNVSWIT